jgi:hypothetical protein
MTAILGLLGGNNDAQKEAEQQAQLQSVSNDRQVADLNRQNDAVIASRRAPRGRRLFEDGPGGDAPSATTAATLGKAT